MNPRTNLERAITPISLSQWAALVCRSPGVEAPEVSRRGNYPLTRTCGLWRSVRVTLFKEVYTLPIKAELVKKDEEISRIKTQARDAESQLVIACRSGCRRWRLSSSRKTMKFLGSRRRLETLWASSKKLFQIKTRKFPI
jgi:hypothetical protein